MAVGLESKADNQDFPRLPWAYTPLSGAPWRSRRDGRSRVRARGRSGHVLAGAAKACACARWCRTKYEPWVTQPERMAMSGVLAGR